VEVDELLKIDSVFWKEAEAREQFLEFSKALL
jgi:hypothetical protein